MFLDGKKEGVVAFSLRRASFTRHRTRLVLPFPSHAHHYTKWLPSPNPALVP